MGITDRLEEQRNKSALGHAEPHLDDGEEVVHWVRVRHPEARKEGFAFLTADRLLICWQAKMGEEPQAFDWPEMEAWGIEKKDHGGPTICVETEGDDAIVHLPARSEKSAGRVSEFLHEFARRAPKPRRSLATPSSERFQTLEGHQVHRERHTALGFTKRIAVTVLGDALILFGLLVGWLPVLPFWLPIIAGLAILASEYDWAKDLSDFFKDKYYDAKKKIKARRQTSE